MKALRNQASPASYFFLVLIVAGISLLIFSFFVGKGTNLFSTLIFSAVGLLLIGIGEWINHPLQESITYDDEEHSSFTKVLHRKRNPIVLGNLLEIVGLVFVFVGMTDIFR